jgi:PAS domain S-box-containing protein
VISAAKVSLNTAIHPVGSCQVLLEDGERVFFRGWRVGDDGNRSAVLVVGPAAEHPSPLSLDRLTHEYGLKDELDGAWAVRPLDLVREGGRTVLVLDDAGGEPLNRLLGAPMEVERFLRLAVGVATALGKLHQRGLIHKDIKPANIILNDATSEVRLTGFGIASRLSRERQAAKPPEALNGTLAYMAPEQTGRMNRSIDSRSDLYALGVTFYQILTGALPFTAADPMEWVHCHLAKPPVAPADRVKEIPDAVSAIIMKLLAKTAEDRYQTAAGLERDLRRCLTEWEAQRRIDDFPLGEHDTPDWLLIPEKLYGREREVETLLASFNRIVNGGAPELVLVSGYSGIGKSSVINELHKALVPRRGLFASGKFDQYKRDIPYSTLAQAFQSLIRDLLAKSEADLAAWCDALHEVLGANGRLMIDLVPELKLIIGEQPPVAELPPQQAQGRFQLVFRRFIGVFARPEHPLALFLDDLQWLDAATLDSLENLVTQPGGECLLVIGAYRDNEVDPTHPLTRKLDAIRKAGAPVQEVRLAPLAGEVVGQLIADTLHCEPAHSAPLSQLMHEKTAGNPFFLIQFLRAAADEGLLTFEHGRERWSWDLDRIRTKGYTENVADLVVGKLSHLPVEVQNALRRLTCLGAGADVTTLSLLLGTSEEQVHADLWDAVRQDFVERSAGTYRFIHDRVQEAAYSLIPEDRRAEAHLRIGRLLVAHTPPGKREEAIFDIVNQLNRGAALITIPDERDQLAELNLIAGKRAKASTAYSTALTYLVAGTTQLIDHPWERRHDLIFALELNRAECEFLTGELSAAEERLTALSNRAATTVERARVACLHMDVCTTLGQIDRAVAICLDYLRHVGIEWSPHPTEDEARREYERIWSLLGGRPIEELIDLPLMSDPDSLATVDVLTKVGPPSLFADSNLHSMVLCKAINLSLEHGNTDGSCVHYVGLSETAGPHFGDYEAGFRFGRLGYELVEQRGLRRFQPATYMVFGGIVLPWTKHVSEGRDLVYRAFEVANKIGDLTYAAYSSHFIVTNLLTSGDPLGEVQREAENSLTFAQNTRFGFAADIITGQLGLIRTLRGSTERFGCFDDERFHERQFEGHLASHQGLALPQCWYWVRKLQARFFSGDYAEAIDASSKAEKLLWTSPSELETADYHFYAALSRAACCDGASAGERQRHLEFLAAHHRQLQVWAANCPQNFENRTALVGAEIARIEGRELEAERLYERAIHSARANGFVNNEAIANELAARFYAARGFEEIAHLYLGNARRGYLLWGADGKVRQLDQLHPRLRDERAPGPTGTIAAPVEHLDLATVLKVSQALSGEIVQEKLLEILMRTAIEQAGAERGVLVLSRWTEPRIAAQATTGGDGIVVQLHDQAMTAAVLPESVIQYVVHTKEIVILDDAAAQNAFSADPCIRRHHARSILCMPLLNQGKLIGVLYLENNLTPHVFTSARLAVLKLLASQAAISLENARLFRDLKGREAKIRRLVDSNIIGIFIWDFEGQILEANEAFLHMVGYEHEELVAGRIRWTDFTPPDWRDRDARWMQEHKVMGSLQPSEKEYLRKDGRRVPVLIGVATFEEGGNQGVAFVVDLTERKRAEEVLRESEGKFRDYTETASDWFWEIGPDYKFTLLSENAFGSHSADRIGAAWRDHALDLETEPTKWRLLWATLDSRKPFRDFAYLGLGGSGSPMYVKASGKPVFDANGEFRGYRGTGTDVTALMRAQEALRESERSLRSAIDGIAGLVVVMAPNGELETVNRPLLEYFGRSLEWLENWGTNDAVHPEDLPRILELFKRAMAYGIPFNFELRLRRFDGEYRWFDNRGVPIRDGFGCIARWYVLLTDIEDRTRALARLDQMQSDFAHMNRVSMMGELTASLSHEITQPIASARNNARAALNFLDRQPPELGDVREALACVVGDADRAGDIIDRIRDHIKKAPPRKHRFDLNEAITEVIVLGRSAITKNEVLVQTRLAEGLFPVQGDRVQLQQVILNLVLNAVEAMGAVEAPRELLMSTEQTEANGVLVAVRDSGPGIHPEHVERVFEAFYTTKSSGTGMGLSICRSIIDAHGGRLWAEANKPRGAVFQFTLPNPGGTS